ncbi:MAG: hypothetical protein J6D30_00765 [Clostridia bacterium]|nr:hypothetical protein [Clostridia bacterium]
MSKQTRKERKEEERRIVAEMEEAMQVYEKAQQEEEPVQEQSGQKRRDIYDDTLPEQIHCRHCRTLMENGVCPNCGFRIYVPMAKEKRDKIRLIVAGICMGIFVVLFIISQIQKG